MNADLDIRLFGGLEARRGGVPLVWRARPERRLLGVLLLARGTLLPADQLTEWLWPAAPADTAAATLRSAVSSLRRTLGGGQRASAEYVLTHSGGYAWNTASAAQVDLYQALTLLTQREEQRLVAATERALDLATGELLPEEPDAPWVLAARARFWPQLLDAAHALAERYLAQGQPDAAARAAQRGLAMAPLHEPLLRALMLAHARRGDTSGALECYERFRHSLDASLGALPAPQTRALHAAILRGTAHEPQPTSVLSLPRTRPAPPPLVGREAELAALSGAVTAALAGSGGMVTVVGEAGIGKSALLSAARRMAQQGGALAITVRAAPLERALPFAPLREALRPLLRAAPDELLQRLPRAALAQIADLLPIIAERLPDLAPPPPAAPTEEFNRQLDGLTDLALALAAAQPLVILCDDAQWADDATLTAVGRLCRRASHHPLLVLLAYRSEELPDNPALHALLRSLGRELLLRPLVPQRLDAAAIGELLASQPDPPLAARPEIAAQLAARTGGNPLFVQVALQALRERNGAATNQTSDGLELSDLVQLAPLRELVLSRLARLEPVARDLVELLALLGRPASLDLVERLAASDGLALADLLLARGLLAETEEQELTISHDLVRSVTAAAISAPQRRRLHRRIADALAALAAPERTNELAQHHAAAGAAT